MALEAASLQKTEKTPLFLHPRAGLIDARALPATVER